MMMISISEFVKNLNGRSFGKPNALLIGFEASARLLGNDLAAVALKQLGLTSTGTSINTNDIRHAWNQVGRDDRYSFLRSAFSTKAPNTASIRDLACIIRQGRIGAIIATDPASALHQQLLNYQVIDADAVFRCCTSKLELFEGIRQSMGERPIFIDAGEILIEGFIPGVHGFDHKYALLIQNTLKEASEKYDKTICWGWSPFNTPVDRIWTSENGRYYVLGQDSSNDRTFLISADMYVVERSTNPPSSEIASLDLLRAVAKELCPDELANDLVRPLNYEQVVGAQITQPRYNSTPLLCDESAANEFIRESRQKGLAVIGVDASVVRNRLASLLVRLIIKNKDMVEHETVTRLDEIANRVSSFNGEPENIFWVVEYVGGRDLPLLAQQSFQDLANSLTANPKLKTLLLVPVFYAAEIDGAAQNIKLYAESLTFEKLFVPARLQAWLREVFPELNDSEDERLAEEMCQIAREVNANGTFSGSLDGIHLALNRWWRSVVSTNQDISDLECLLEVWSDALASFAQRSEGEDQDEGDSWSIRPRSSENDSLPDDLDDWDLGVVSRPRRDPDIP